MDIDLYLKIMNELCEISTQLNDIQKDIKCIKDQTKSNGGHLPELTPEVFNHPGCPKWAKYAGIAKDGNVIFYEDKTSLGAKADIGVYDASDWENSLIERPVKLPRLTIEVFNRPDCPKWARYAVVNSKGTLIFFGNKPKFEGEDYGCWSCSCCPYKHIRSIVFDASDWENSLIERPAQFSREIGHTDIVISVKGEYYD